jgi:hypothetical protein
MLRKLIWLFCRKEDTINPILVIFFFVLALHSEAAILYSPFPFARCSPL